MKVVALLLLAVIAIAGILTAFNSNVATWEYQIVAIPDVIFKPTMTELGIQGWELAAARRATGDGGPSYEVILKRRCSLFYRTTDSADIMTKAFMGVGSKPETSTQPAPTP